MSTATQRPQQQRQQTHQQAPPAQSSTPLVDAAIERTAEFVPLGEDQPIKLSIKIVRDHFVTPTKKGAYPPDSQLSKFVMLCKTQRLNPYAGDCCITGYDTEHGPNFSLIVQIQALLKRAEKCQAFDGIESGIIVASKSGEIQERNGDLRLDGERLIGAWAKAFRKDRSRPFYRVVNRAAFDNGRSRWKTDPEGMLRKCAQAGALREAFPNELSGLTVEGEPQSDYVEKSLPAGLTAVVAETEARQSVGDDIAGHIEGEAAANPAVPGDTSGVDLAAVAKARLAKQHNEADIQSTIRDLMATPGMDEMTVLTIADARRQELGL